MPRAHDVRARALHDSRWLPGLKLAPWVRGVAIVAGWALSCTLGGVALTVLGCRYDEGSNADVDEGGGGQSLGVVVGTLSAGAHTPTPADTTAPHENQGDGGTPQETGAPNDSLAPPLKPLMREVLGSEEARVVPDGTPPEIAATFSRIPVTVSDHGPVGGIGESGLHADRMSLGTVFRKNRCRGPLERYAVSSGDDVNFCFRAVHRRIDEQVTVHWRKEGRLVRRSFINIPAIHAYRTRAKLALRREYVGWWDVIAMVKDGTEIARGRFEVVE